jgi:hypothetical protein
MKGKILGILILGVVIVGTLVYYFVGRAGGPGRPGEAAFRGVETTLTGYIGSEKNNFLNNPEILKRLAGRYGLGLDFHKAGSIEMIRTDMAEGADFLWPSSRVALELFKLTGKPSEKNEIIFNSPIVFYSWDRVVDALQARGLVKNEGGVYYTSDIDKLISLVLEDVPWAELGLDELYGTVTVISTDPTKSNSGNMFAGLLANLLSGEVVTEERPSRRSSPSSSTSSPRWDTCSTPRGSSSRGSTSRRGWASIP